MVKKSTLPKIILPIIILLVGFLVMKALISQHKAPEKTERPNLGALVQVLKVKKTMKQVEVFSTGSVQATEEISVALQVSGQITEISPNFVAGGFFQAGELLFAVDTADYQFALQQAKASLAKTENSLAVAQGKAKIARLEWQRLHPDGTPKPTPLAIHEPQLQEARANLNAAEANVKQARLNLTRTRMTAPFNCRVRSERIGPGQFVKSGESVAVLSAIDEVEIIVPLSRQEIRWLKIPVRSNGKKGSPARIILTSGDANHSWQGQVVRSMGEADPKDRMIRVVVRVKNPYRSLQTGKTSRPDLIPGTYVDVVFQGKELSDVIVLPLTALRDNATVWIMDQDNKLRIRAIKKNHQEEDSFWVSKGLEEGERVITTTLSGGSDGMLLRLLQQEEQR